MTEKRDGDTEKLSPEQTAALHKGEKIEEGPFTLRYNQDGEGHYRLEYQGEVHSWSWTFTRIERPGVNVWNLAHVRRAGFYVKDIENYPLIRKAFYTINKATPDEVTQNK